MLAHCENVIKLLVSIVIIFVCVHYVSQMYYVEMIKYVVLNKCKAYYGLSILLSKPENIM